MCYIGDDSVQLPVFGPEPPYSTAIEGLQGLRTRQHEPSIVPSTYAYTESELLITHPGKTERTYTGVNTNLRS